ncbi:MAG TPA: HAD-IB family hydrolase [Acidimicrobiales bacterium]
MTGTAPADRRGEANRQGEADRQGEAAVRPGVAAFDFDGTLARRDTLVPFLRRACGRRRLSLATARVAPRCRTRDELKLALLATLFRGWPEERLLELGRTYAASLPALFRPELAERLRWHQDQGHAVVIVSASLAAYLRPLGEALGVDEVLAVELLAADGTLTGAVAGGANCRGPGKVERLRAWLDARYGPGAEVELWAYGDSSGDAELLALADHPTWVGRRARSRRATGPDPAAAGGRSQSRSR